MKKLIEVFKMNEIEFEDQSTTRMAKIIPHSTWPEDLSREEALEFEELQGEDYQDPLPLDHPAVVMARGQGYKQKLNDSFFYHPKHWKLVEDFKDHDQRNFWYWTTTDGRVALKALTKEAKDFLSIPSVEQFNTPWGRPKNGKEGKLATMWLVGQIDIR